MLISAGCKLKRHFLTGNGTLETVSIPKSRSCKITQVSISYDGSVILCLPENQKPQIFAAKDKESVKLKQTINILNVSALTFKNNTKKIVAMGTYGGDIIIYDTAKRTILNSYPKICGKIKFLEFTCDDEKLCVCDAFNFFVFPEINTSINMMKFRQPSEIIWLKNHPFSPGRVVLCYANQRMSLFDIELSLELINQEILNCQLTGIALTSCGKYLIVSGKNIICRLDILSRKHTFEYQLDQEKSITCIKLNADDKQLAVGFADGTLELIDITKEITVTASAKVQDSPINTLAFLENKFADFLRRGRGDESVS